MPNTKSAERRMRTGARKQLHHHSVKSKLKSLEKQYLDLIQTGKKDEAALAYRQMTSTLDKAVKAGVVHYRQGDRKKSRLALQLAKAK
jgi:small subunit ribosomal protein S20